MKYSIPTNWDDDFINHISRIPEIKEVYGKLDKDFVGGGRPSIILSRVSKKKVSKHINLIHKSGFEFNYLLNAVCLGNREFTRKGQNELRRLLDWLSDINVDKITVATPYLLKWIKKNYSNIKIDVSTNAFISNINEAKYWEKLGCNAITLFSNVLNRDFKKLSQIRDNIDCKLKLIANNGCTYNCPTYYNHVLSDSHASQSWHNTRGFLINYYYIECRYRRLCDPVDIIRADWIRPEDVSIYEDLGIDCLKLVSRDMPTNRLLNIVNAYYTREYKGNLLDLLATFYGARNRHGLFEKIRAIKYLFKPNFVNIFKLKKLNELIDSIEITLDNQSLDGFIDYFRNHQCDPITCDKGCKYCHKVLRNSLKTNKDLNKVKNKYRNVLSQIEDGSFFSYIG